jgi:hypothetical protein
MFSLLLASPTRDARTMQQQIFYFLSNGFSFFILFKEMNLTFTYDPNILFVVCMLNPSSSSSSAIAQRRGERERES